MRRFFPAVLVAALVTVGALVGASPAQAATCNGASCYGKNPYTEGCAGDAYTPTGAAFSSAAGYVELRYSPSCNANWAKVSNSYAGAWLYVQNQYGHSQQTYVPSGVTGTYTLMVTGETGARAGNSHSYTGWY
ncbi:hypothetical protein GCM10027290_33190 [Micromonospora sonneratiae]|uniref:DUF2690 domain-containing protein n=1 Tax=Micromonospora sonneratiae TaxID=1184706 RepID=A0ABW3YAE3_9ACTN